MTTIRRGRNAPIESLPPARGFARAFRIITIICIVFSPIFPHPVWAKSRPPIGPVAMRYSADDKVCKPLVGLLLKLHHRYPKALYLGEIRNALFDRTGVLPPPWIDHPDPQIDRFYPATGVGPAAIVPLFREQGDGYWSGGAFFRAGLSKNQQQSLVLVQQDNVGVHGDYETYIYLMKPGVTYRGLGENLTPDQRTDLNFDPQTPDPSVVDLQLPGRRLKGFADVEFPADPPANKDAKTAFLYFPTRVEQEPIVFREHLYVVTGRPLLGYIVVYNLYSTPKPKIVCLATTDDYFKP